jgi:hypothetical protein
LHRGLAGIHVVRPDVVDGPDRHLGG